MQKLGFVMLGATLLVGTMLTYPGAAAGAPCTGARKLRLSWSQRTRSVSLFLSATLCAPPPPCSGTRPTPDGVLVTKAPLTLRVVDAAGTRLSGLFNPNGPVNRDGCPSGIETYGSQFSYTFGEQRGQTTLVGRHLRIRAAQRPTLTPPVTASVIDANGYAVDAVMHTCRARQSATAVTIDCFESGTR